MTQKEIDAIIAKLPDPNTVLSDRIKVPYYDQLKSKPLSKMTLEELLEETGEAPIPNTLTFRKKYNYQRTCTGWELV